MSKSIEISSAIYERLGKVANPFETPESVISRLLDFYENHQFQDINTDESTPLSHLEIRTFGKLEINFFPSDLTEFKSMLLANKQAWVMLYRQDGSKDIHQWNAMRFTERSDVLGNLRSGYLRGWRDKGIVKADVAINREDIL